MRKWEDMVKDKLEGYESALPEGGLAAFLAGGEKVTASPARRAAPWIWGLGAVAAAGLAAVLFLRQPAVPVESVPAASRQEVAVTRTMPSGEQDPMPDTRVASVLVPFAPKTVQGPEPGEQRQSGDGLRWTENTVETTGESDSSEPAPETDPGDPADGPVTPGAKDEAPVSTASPFLPDRAVDRSVHLTVAPAAGLITGGSLLAAMATSFFRVGDVMQTSRTQGTFKYGKASAHSFNQDETDVRQYPLSGSPVHGYPLKLGVSVRVPVADRLFVSTGLSYARYQSSLTFSGVGEKKQLAHYLGIPLRLDRIIASNGRWDAYIGAGIEGDYCVGATLGGAPVGKDGFGLSLMGAGGVQWNFTDALGLYVEPEIIWAVPSERRVLMTYRTEHPFMLSVTGGIRVNIGK